LSTADWPDLLKFTRVAVAVRSEKAES